MTSPPIPILLAGIGVAVPGGRSSPEQLVDRFLLPSRRTRYRRVGGIIVERLERSGQEFGIPGELRMVEHRSELGFAHEIE